MDLRFSEEDEAFRSEVAQWLAEHLSGEFAELRGRGGPGDESALIEERRAWERKLGADEPWAVLGQSFGGFCATHYLSAAPEGLSAVFITGGLPPLEAPTSTLFWVSPNGSLRTTAVEAGVLDSITRAKIIAGTEVETGEFPLEDVLEASEAFLASTTREVQPVRSVDGHEIPTGPSPRTIEAARVFAAALENELGRIGDRADGTVPPPKS